MEKARHVFYLSDRTGKTAEAIGQSLLSQFGDYQFESKVYSFLDTIEKVKEAATIINQTSETNKEESIVFNTIVNSDHQKIIAETNSCVIDLFGEFISPLEQSLNTVSSYASGMAHEKFEFQEYNARIDAIDFTLSYDDGVRFSEYEKADIVLLGVSRSGKSPTCIYLAMNFSVKAANYPLSEEQLDSGKLPDSLINNLDKIVGLTISPKQLFEMRQKRRPGTEYSSFATCEKEIKQAKRLFEDYKIPFVESTSTSIEEISVQLLKLKELI